MSNLVPCHSERYLDSSVDLVLSTGIVCCDRNGASARGPWLLEEILRWGTARLFDPPPAHAPQELAHAKEAALVEAPKPDPKPEAEQPAAMETDGEAKKADAAAGDKGSNADDTDPEAGQSVKEEAAPVMNEAAEYSDAALDALICWGTGAASKDASSGAARIWCANIFRILALRPWC